MTSAPFQARRAARALVLLLPLLVLCPAVGLAAGPAVGVIALRPTEVRPEARFLGRIEAVDSVEIVARVVGFIEARRFREGETVAVGDLLYSIERGPYEAALAQADAEVASAQAELRFAQLDFERKRELVARQAVAQAQLEESIAKRDEAQAALLGAEARRKQVALDLAYTEIRAPIAGRIGRAAASVGDLVGPDAGTLARIVAQDPAYVTFSVTQRELLATRSSAEAAGVSTSDVEVIVQLGDDSIYPGSARLTSWMGLMCLIPGFDGALFSQGWKDALWDRFFMAAPQRQRQFVKRYKIVKRA